jgi:hypothetical protein
MASPIESTPSDGLLSMFASEQGTKKVNVGRSYVYKDVSTKTVISYYNMELGMTGRTSFT